MSSRAAAARLIGAAHKIVTVLVVTGMAVAWLLWPAADRAAGQSDDETEPALLLIMDSSGSMNGGDGSGGTKIQAAKTALNGVVNALPGDSLVGCASTAIASRTPTRKEGARTLNSSRRLNLWIAPL